MKTIGYQGKYLLTAFFDCNCFNQNNVFYIEMKNEEDNFLTIATSLRPKITFYDNN